MARLHEVPGCRVLSIENGHEAGVVMHVRGCRCAGRCPGCGTLSTARRGSYQRHPADLLMADVDRMTGFSTLFEHLQTTGDRRPIGASSSPP